MANEVWRLPYTEGQIQEAFAHIPPVVGENGNWWMWDISAMAYVDSGHSVGVKNGNEVSY